MSNTSTPSRPKTASSSALMRRLAFLAILIIAVGAGVWIGRSWPGRLATNSVPPPSADASASADGETSAMTPTRIQFDAAHQASAGIQIEPAKQSDAQESIVLTGKLAVDEDRLAHIYSMVEGVLRRADVRLGQEIKAGQELALVDSREVGQTKLDLAKNRLNLSFAEVNHQWAEMIHKNTQALIVELLKNPPISEVENHFRDQPMGDNRQLLVSAYAKFHQTEADFGRLKTLREQNVGVEKDYIRAKAEFESASAAYQALLEQLKFTTQQSLLEADQKRQEALTAERMCRSQLLILGFEEKSLDKLDPLAEGEAVAHYPIRAPFNGTVIGKHAVLSEHVGPEHQLYEIADLATVRLHADVFEKDLAALDRMTGKSLTFQAAGYPGRQFTASIVNTGNVVDEKTRAVRVVAVADNAERLLKPGMFVQVSLPIGAAQSVVVVPSSALQGQGAESYLFVAQGPTEFEKRTVRVGRTLGTNVEVLSGIAVGDQVVVRGGFALKSEMMKDLLEE